MISLEYVDQMDPASMADGDLVAFISLYHFTYLCQPPLTVDFVDGGYLRSRLLTVYEDSLTWNG